MASSDHHSHFRRRSEDGTFATGVPLTPERIEALDGLSDGLEGVAVAAVAAAIEPPETYNSRERGPGVVIDDMNPVWARRAAAAVARGDRPEDSPAVIAPLRKRAREG